MTNKEAIEILKELENEVYNEDRDGYKQYEAIDLAIKALALSDSIDELSDCIGTRLYEPYRQISIDEYIQRTKGNE